MSNRWARQAACIALALCVALGVGTRVAAGQDVPFKGGVAAVITEAVPGAGGLHITLIGSGNATHLGRFTRVENIVLHPDFTLDGEIVFTAANGDQLFVDVVGGFTSPTTAAGSYTITGGTGRFDDATGTAAFTGSTTDGLHFSIDFAGTISF
jgi:hypothetical protein